MYSNAKHIPGGTQERRRPMKVMNASPAKAGGFGLRLEAGSIGRSAD
jgi:hypothetical protein